MPSTSPEQRHTMAALAHGWKPPRGSKVSRIPLSVAQEFFKADQAAKGKKSVAQSG